MCSRLTVEIDVWPGRDTVTAFWAVPSLTVTVFVVYVFPRRRDVWGGIVVSLRRVFCNENEFTSIS